MKQPGEMKPSDELNLLVDAVETDPNATQDEIYALQARWFQALANEGDTRAQQIVERTRELRPDFLTE